MLNSKPVTIKSFNQLNKNELYAILAARVQIFCVEQNCPYQDLDNQDQEAIHVFVKDEKTITVYARILKGKNNTYHIGRVIVDKNYRKKGLAILIMRSCIVEAKSQGANKIEISAQSYLNDFYQGLGFRNTGKYYLEDDIPHQQMILEGEN
jgi:ElaA protein